MSALRSLHNSTLSITPVNELYRDKLNYSVKEQGQLECLTMAALQLPW